MQAGGAAGGFRRLHRSARRLYAAPHSRSVVRKNNIALTGRCFERGRACAAALAAASARATRMRLRCRQSAWQPTPQNPPPNLPAQGRSLVGACAIGSASASCEARGRAGGRGLQEPAGWWEEACIRPAARALRRAPARDGPGQGRRGERGRRWQPAATCVRVRGGGVRILCKAVERASGSSRVQGPRPGARALARNGGEARRRCRRQSC